MPELGMVYEAMMGSAGVHIESEGDGLAVGDGPYAAEYQCPHCDTAQTLNFYTGDGLNKIFSCCCCAGVFYAAAPIPKADMMSPVLRQPRRRVKSD